MPAKHKISPDQLKMFMSPREIHEHYQPLDADREAGPHSEEWTERSRTTGGQTNEVYPSYGGRTRTYVRPETIETDEELWARKLDEASRDPDEYHEMRTGMPRIGPNYEALLNRSSYPQHPGTERSSAIASWEGHEASYINRKEEEFYSAPSLTEHVAEKGVEIPVHLGTQFGSSGKREIVGGHHRIAAATETRPNDLIPVLHHENIRQAKSGTAFKYT